MLLNVHKCGNTTKKCRRWGNSGELPCLFCLLRLNVLSAAFVVTVPNSLPILNWELEPLQMGKTENINIGQQTVRAGNVLKLDISLDLQKF